MKVAVVAPGAVPHVVGGAEWAWAGLVSALGAAGHEVEMVKIPAPERDAGEIVASYRSFAALHLDHFDRVVTTKYPAWMVAHPGHVVYVFHTLRGLYDTYHLSQLPEKVDLDALSPSARALARALRIRPERGALGEVLDLAEIAARETEGEPDLALPSPLLRSLVHWFDRVALSDPGVQRIVALSDTVAARDYYPPGVRPRGVPLPSDLEVTPGVEERQGFFTASRLDKPKRVDLLIDAWAEVPGPDELLIAGSGPEEAALRRRAEGDPRIRFLGRVDDDELVERYRHSRGVLFVPFDEDLGLITLEAFRAETPVITTTDSGGVAEFVEHDRSGLVVEPEPSAIAAAVRELATNPVGAAAMGRAGAAASARITWESVVDALFDGLDGSRRRIVVLSTYPIEPAVGGGQRRCRHLFEPLSDRWEVHYVCLGFPGQKASSTRVADGVIQTVVPRSPDHDRLEERLTLAAGIPLGDVAATMLGERTPDLVTAVRMAAVGADLAVLAQPYLLPVLRAASPTLPFVLDAQNDESALKADLLDGDLGRALLRVVESVEAEAAGGAERLVVCSPADGRTLGRHRRPGSAVADMVSNGTDVLRTRFVTGDERRHLSASWLDAWRRAGGRAAARLALFVGSWHPPNLDAAESIFTAAVEQPQTIFVIAGNQCAAFPSRKLPDNVVLRGQISDAELFGLLAAADVALNPMRLGAGTNLKVLQYFAAGVPVVSTAVGVRGLAVEPGVHFVEIGEQNDLAAGIEEASDPVRSPARVAAARDVAEREYDWAVLADRFADIVDEVVHGDGG